ncbi:hypothetical protein Anas_12094 [Armadillidium nasatum]|uniref:Uncharacterized protein n=1 Tax=Armadillidium nasatum TaxID=96803 RepID=A0A5N5SLN6_9CRUS|nr:hypothetical protein Anas_12094 [Armadillidium nasatum]
MNGKKIWGKHFNRLESSCFFKLCQIENPVSKSFDKFLGKIYEIKKICTCMMNDFGVVRKPALP